MAVKKQNRYLLIARKKGCNHASDIVNGETLDLSKVIIIDVPYIEDEKKNLDLPRRKVKNLDSKKLERQAKRPLSLIDLFIFEHSKNGEEDFKQYLKNELHYQIPYNYTFAIVYRSKDEKEETCFKFLEPIYGNRTSIVLWLSELAKTEYENRVHGKMIAQEQMFESSAWKSVWNNIIKPDILKKGSVVNSFLSWVDTRGSVNQMKKDNQKDSFEKMIVEIEKDRQYVEAKLNSLQKYPLAVIMEICQRHSNNSYAWISLKKKLSSYKELRGFLLCRYHFKKNELKNELESMLKRTKVNSSNLSYPIELNLVEPYISIYDLLRYSDYTFETLEKEEYLNSEIKNFDFEIKQELENYIKDKKRKDVPSISNYYFIQDGELKRSTVEIEHEEETMYPEDFLPEYQDPDMIRQIEDERIKMKRR